MDAFEIFKLLADAPLTLVILYLLVREQNAHAETRKARDTDQRDFVVKYSELARQGAIAMEMANDALRDIRDVLKDIHRLTPTKNP